MYSYLLNIKLSIFIYIYTFSYFIYYLLFLYFYQFKLSSIMIYSIFIRKIKFELQCEINKN